MTFYIDAVARLSRWGAGLAAALISAIMLLTSADVALRYLFSAPINGALEISEMLFMAATLLCFAIVEVERSNIAVRFVIDRLGERAQAVVSLLQLATCLAMSSLIVRQTWVTAVASLERGEFRQGYTIYLPSWPARFALPIGFGMLCLAIVANMLIEARKLSRRV